MTKYEDLFLENGQFTDEGKRRFKVYEAMILNALDCKDISVAQARHMGGCLAKVVGEATRFKCNQVEVK